jgi:hypothetical protein
MPWQMPLHDRKDSDIHSHPYSWGSNPCLHAQAGRTSRGPIFSGQKDLYVDNATHIWRATRSGGDDSRGRWLLWPGRL